MQFEMTNVYTDYRKTRYMRDFTKWAFSILTGGLGALYLWATTTIVKEGEIGLRRNYRGDMILLPPGRHSNFPWESYPVEPQSLSNPEINLGPYKIITVATGEVGKTFHKGKLVVLGEGQHILEEASHVFKGFIPVKQETKKLHEVTAYTSDNVGLTLHADIRYQIEKPEIAISQIDGIENSITEIGEIVISQIVSHHTLVDFAPVTNVGHDHPHGISDVISEITNRIKDQLSQLGIKLLNIGITSWSINDKGLAHELAQGAVIQSQARSKMLSAQQEAEVKQILAQATANAKVTTAQSEAESTKIKGAAIREVAEQFRDNPVGQAMFASFQQIEMIRGANNPHLFFSQSANNSNLFPQLTLPVPTQSSAPAQSSVPALSNNP